YTIRGRRAQQAISDTRNASHQAGYLYTMWYAGTPSLALDTFQHLRNQALYFWLVVCLTRKLCRAQQEFQITQISVTERMICAEAFCQRNFYGQGNLRTH